LKESEAAYLLLRKFDPLSHLLAFFAVKIDAARTEERRGWLCLALFKIEFFATELNIFQPFFDPA
jgi:hypothetical protein